MSKLTLVIGNKNYSSWSLRPWFLLRKLGVEFQEIRIPLYTENSGHEISRYSPSGRVPVLLAGDLRVWESLAICEYVAEQWPALHAWPSDMAARAHARSAATEMHAGFTALRSEMSMTCRGRRSGVIPSPAAVANIRRIVSLWQESRERHGQHGPWLYGDFSIADAMYAPVVLRFHAYGVELPEFARSYVQTVLTDPALQIWIAEARAETEVLPKFECGTPID